MKYILYAQAHFYRIEALSGVLDKEGLSLLRDFSRILGELGEVIEIDRIEEAEPIYRQCVEKGEACVLLSFAQPHLTPITLTCPVVPVFSWEYADIPENIEEHCWQDDPRHDWRFALSKSIGAIVLSSHARDLVRQSMGAMYPVAAVNWPLNPQLKAQSASFRALPHPRRRPVLSIRGAVGDSEQMGLNVDAIVCEDDDDTPAYDPLDEIDLPLRADAGMHARCAPAESPAAKDHTELWVSEPLPCSWQLPPVVYIRTRLRGNVYTAVLSMSREQDNWIDLVTAFCWSFRHVEDATLVLIVDDPLPESCQLKLVTELSKLSPLKCRVLAIYGLPSADEYAALIRATTYYVNTSCASASCRHAADFMAAGVPAIAPAHTALRDLVHAGNAFVIRSMPGIPRAWPHGDQEISRTRWHQIDWQSLVEAFRKSYAVARDDPGTYLAMGHLARSRALAHCSHDAVKTKIQQFLRDILAPELLARQKRQSPPLTTTLGRNHDIARLHQHRR
jgi:glycosyltransferase involved in cell wall biosynthesis